MITKTINAVNFIRNRLKFWATEQYENAIRSAFGTLCANCQKLLLPKEQYRVRTTWNAYSILCAECAGSLRKYDTKVRLK